MIPALMARSEANFAVEVGMPINQRMQITEISFGKKVIVVSATDPDEFEERTNCVARSPPTVARKYISTIVPGFFFKREHRNNIEAWIAYIKTTVNKQ